MLVPCDDTNSSTTIEPTNQVLADKGYSTSEDERDREIGRHSIVEAHSEAGKQRITVAAD